MGTPYNNEDEQPPLISEESSYADIRKKIVDLTERHAANAFTLGCSIGVIVGATLVFTLMSFRNFNLSAMTPFLNHKKGLNYNPFLIRKIH